MVVTEKSRKSGYNPIGGTTPGFHDHQQTPGSFLDLFAKLRRERIIPA